RTARAAPPGSLRGRAPPGCARRGGRRPRRRTRTAGRPATCTTPAVPGGRWRGAAPASRPRRGVLSLHLDDVAGQLHVEGVRGELLVEAHALEADGRVVARGLGEPRLHGDGALGIHPEADRGEEPALAAPRLEVEHVRGAAPHALVPHERDLVLLAEAGGPGPEAHEEVGLALGRPAEDLLARREVADVLAVLHDHRARRGRLVVPTQA